MEIIRYSLDLCGRAVAFAPSLVLLYLVWWIAYTRLSHPLAGVPGPLAASITRFWYVYRVQQASFDKEIRALHNRYGRLVRIAPNEVSVSDPEAIKIIYGIQSTFTKTDFYIPWRAQGFETNHLDNFTNPDESSHAVRRRIVSSIYSMSSILESEVFIDKATSTFCEKLEDFARSGDSMDIGVWLQMYAFDVIGELYFGDAFGFLKTGEDYGRYIESLDALFPPILGVALLPIGLRTLYLSLGMISSKVRRALPCMQSITDAAKSKVEERQQSIETNSGRTRRDLLAKLFDIKQEKGDVVDFKVGDIQMEAWVAIFAGSDSTAVALRAILERLIRHADVYQKLMRELDQAHAKGELDSPVSYAQAIKLPYLTACIKEATRLHPSVSLQLPRHVPKGGCEISGHYFPAGWRVGINASVVHYDTTVFGADAAEFRPERWLVSNPSSMDRYIFQFGAGARSCMGKNISLAEMHKLIPQLMLRFRFELVNPEKPLRNVAIWWNKQTEFQVRVSRR